MTHNSLIQIDKNFLTEINLPLTCIFEQSAHYMETDDGNVIRDIFETANDQAFSVILRKVRTKLYCTKNSSCYSKHDHMRHQNRFLNSVILWKYSSEEISGYSSRKKFKHRPISVYQRLLRFIQDTTNDWSSKSGTTEDDSPHSWYLVLVVLYTKHIIRWIFVRITCWHQLFQEPVVIVEIWDNPGFRAECPTNHSCTRRQESLQKRPKRTHHFNIGYNTSISEWLIEILLSVLNNKISAEEDAPIVCLYIKGIPTYDPRSRIDLSSKEGSPRTDTYYSASSDLCLYLKNTEDSFTRNNSYCKNEEVLIPLLSLVTEITDCLNALPLSISVDEKIHLILVLENAKVCRNKIIPSSKFCKQFEYCCVFEKDVLLALVIYFQHKHQAEDRPVTRKDNSVVGLRNFYEDCYVDLYHECCDVKDEVCGELNHQRSDCAKELNKVISKKLKNVIQRKKLKEKHASKRKSRRYSGCHAKYIPVLKQQMFFSLTKISIEITLSDNGKEITSFQHHLVVNYEISRLSMVSKLFQLHHKLEDCYVADVYDDVDYHKKRISHPEMTKNSIHTVSWNTGNCLTNCDSKRHIKDDEICSKTCDTYDLPVKSDAVKKFSSIEASDVEPYNRFYQEIPEEQKLLQPPELDPADKRYRISTLINNRVHISNCSIQNLCDAGFYLDEDGLMHCFRCHVTFSLEAFHPRDPQNSKWHGSSCGGLVSQTQSDGRISDDVRDPPGQQSIYIPSGDVRDERYRLSTFAKYPVSSAANKVNLARTGFYFTGYSDRVRCFSCGRTVERWEAADNPMNATWHKSSCAMQRGLACGNIPIPSQFHFNTPIPNNNQFTSVPQRIQSGSASHSNNFRGGLRPGTSQVSHTHSNAASASQRPRQWRMANVVSSDHRRYLTNLYLNRELDRLASFTRWPAGRQTVSPESLAKAGFFYLGDADRTQCFSCGGVLRNWTASDSPEIEHSQNFPQCHMVQGMETRNVPIPMQSESREERERNFPCRHPTNPHMRSEATRLDTFDRRWPMGRIQATPDEIAHAGFFFLGDRDRTKCWYCNGGLQNWDYEDAPWVEHAKWFPNCQFLLRMKGQHFVYRHLVSNAHLQRPIIAKQEGSAIDQPSSGLSTASSSPRTPDVPPESRSASQPAAAPTIIDPREEIRKRKEIVQNAMKNSDIVKNTITMGFDPKIIESLLENKLAEGKQANNEDIYDSMSELLNDVMEKEQEREEEKNRRAAEAPTTQHLPSMFPSFSSTVPSTSYVSSPVTQTGRGKYNVYYDDDDDDDDFMNMYGSTEGASTHTKGSEPTHPAVGAIGNFQDTASMQEAMAKIEEESLCKICFSNKADMVFLPCSHMCCCMECTQAIRQCPLCRIPIEKAIKTYVT